MHITGVGERDGSWENHHPTFRVYLFDSGDAARASRATDTYDVTGADVLDAIQWAQDQAGENQLYAVALVAEDTTQPVDHRCGLIWLVGMDANDTPANEAGRARQAAMLARRGKRVVDLA